MCWWDSGGSCCFSDTTGYIGDYGRGACFSSDGGGRGGVGGSYVSICGSFVDKSKKIVSVWIIAFVLFVSGGDCSRLNNGGIGACYFCWLVGSMVAGSLQLELNL